MEFLPSLTHVMKTICAITILRDKAYVKRTCDKHRMYADKDIAKTRHRKGARMLLSRILDTDKLRQEIHARNIAMCHHPEIPELAILCHTQKASDTWHWNKVTRNCHGMAIRLSMGHALDSAEILSRGRPKAYAIDTISCADDDTACARIYDPHATTGETRDITLDTRLRAVATKTVSGTTCIGYVLGDRFCLHGTDSFDHPDVIAANRLIRDMSCDMAEWLRQETYDRTHQDFDMTAVLKYVSPPHVTSDKTCLCVIGWVSVRTGAWYPSYGSDAFASLFGFSVPETCLEGTLKDVLAEASHDDAPPVTITCSSSPQLVLAMGQHSR